MLQIRKDLCLGCGMCVESCPQGAISLLWSQAEIDPNRCNSCGLCVDVCPQGIIVEMVPVSKEYLVNMVGSLREQVDDIIQRLEKLKVGSRGANE